MNNYPKRLIEVDLPIKRISAHARREKSIRHGHISTLHIWWARRPLAACRAVVCASLWPDPADVICPPRFVETAKRLMYYWGERCLQKCSADSYPRFNKIVRTPACLDDGMELRKALLDFIADFANWDNSTITEYLSVARTLTVAAHDALEDTNAFALPEFVSVESLNDAIKDVPRPLLVDPFAGGGAIPLEGLRCGADAFASDLNPVAVLLNKVVLEYIPKYGQRLADEVEKWGKWIKKQAEKELAEFYPKDEDGAAPIAYLWARTITCEGPNCGITIPMMNQLWIKKDGKPTYAFRFAVKNKEIVITIDKNPKRSEVGRGTTAQGSVTCPACGYTNAANRVRAVGQAGGLGHRMIGVVLSNPGSTERRFRKPSDKDHHAFEKALSAHSANKHEFSRLLNTEIPRTELRRVSVPLYGLDTFGALFLPRQKLAFDTLLQLLQGAKKHHSNNDAGLNSATIDVIALAISNVLHYNMNLSTYLLNHMVSAFIQGTSLAMRSDFAEAYPLMDRLAGGLDYSVKQINRMITSMLECNAEEGTVARHTATSIGLPDNSVALVFTDPPYYDSIPYSHLSDLFYLWLKASIGNTHSNLFSSSLIEKESEIVEDRAHSQSPTQKNANFFEAEMQKAMADTRRIVANNQMQVVVFAHKSTEGWEAMLLALIEAGWTVVAAWPIDTERPARMNAYQNASLLSSIHVVCRPRENPDSSLRDETGDWRDVLSELPGRIAAWLPRLASEGVVGADAIFACLGPALEIFSRYSSVEKASGEVVPLREYLEHVWAEVARQALNMIFEGADASGFEEDARLTAMWLWTLRTEANGNGEDDDKVTSLPGYTLEYDAARKIAQGLGCHLENLTHLVEVKGNKAMLLSAESRARYLFGKEDLRATAKRNKKKAGPVQQDLFSLLGVPDVEETAAERAELERPPAGKTALDQLHQAMLLFTAGRGAALKRFLVDDGIGTNPQFWTLAQAFSALYPSHTNEKRWVDGVLARKKGLGF
jgi:adenine-specific DNA methylase